MSNKQYFLNSKIIFMFTVQTRIKITYLRQIHVCTKIIVSNECEACMTEGVSVACRGDMLVANIVWKPL